MVTSYKNPACIVGIRNYFANRGFHHTPTYCAMILSRAPVAPACRRLLSHRYVSTLSCNPYIVSTAASFLDIIPLRSLPCTHHFAPLESFP